MQVNLAGSQRLLARVLPCRHRHSVCPSKRCGQCFRGVITRVSGGILRRQVEGYREGRKQSIDSLERIKGLTLEMKEALLTGDLPSFAEILDENLLNVGRRSAFERLAYLLLHLFTRGEEVGLTKGNSIGFPFTQQHVADTLGMSLVHTNKTLKRLVATKTVRWKDKVFEVLDRPALAALAGHEPPQQRAPIGGCGGREPFFLKPS